MRFMVVDDSQVMRNQISKILQGRYELVGDASNGREALEQFRQLKPKFVTMDMTMPEMEGKETIEAMVAEDPKVRILVVSALKDQDAAMDALAAGAYGFLCKPFTDYELVESIEELVSDM